MPHEFSPLCMAGRALNAYIVQRLTLGSARGPSHTNMEMFHEVEARICSMKERPTR